MRSQARELALPSKASVLVAAERKDAPFRHFTGKIEDPALLGAIIEAFPRPLSPMNELGAELLAGWDFSLGIDTQAITDVGPQACHGRLVNLPTRAVVGARWSGREMCWRHAPRDYGAIHFHDDDLDDCGWEPSFTWTVPSELEERRLCVPSQMRSGRGLVALLRPAAPARPVCPDRFPRLDLHLPGLCQPCARQCG